MSKDVLILHRGLTPGQSRPNSFEAIRDKYESAFECDVFMLADGALAIVHNKDMGLSQEQIEAMTTGVFYSLHVKDRETQTEGSPAPLFREYLALALDRGNKLALEIKGSSPQMARKTARRIVEETRGLDPKLLQSSISLHSFSVEALEEAQDAMREHGVQMKRALFWPSAPARALEMSISATVLSYLEGEYSSTEIPQWTEAGIKLAHQKGFDIIDLQEGVITPDLVRKAHSYGIEVNAWVVNNADRAKVLENMSVDHIITDTLG